MSAIVVKSASVFAFAALVAFGCNPEAEEAAGSDQADAQGSVSGASSALAPEFFDPIPKGNGRACATCHAKEGNFTISPAEAEARFQANPNDPLFRSIDADDFANDYTTVRTKALFRVTIPLPSNIKLANDPAATSVQLWRAVPSIFNVKLTAPYTHDGRGLTLAEQAKGAAAEHSRPSELPKAQFFNNIAAFQATQFSSKAIADISALIDAGGTPPPPGQDYGNPPLTALEQQGFAAFQEHCIVCHGGNARNQIDQAAIPLSFFTAFVSELNRANLPVLDFLVTNPDGTVTPVSSPDPGRMLISGQASDANFFDSPPLRGISKTAPYFHDNSARNFDELFAHYNILFTAFGFPTIRPDQVAPLTAYLNRL